MRVKNLSFSFSGHQENLLRLIAAGHRQKAARASRLLIDSDLGFYSFG
jgi:hypothetical protein